MLSALTLISVLAWPELVQGAARRGFAAHYSNNVMEKVARNRGMQPTACDVAVTDNHRIGSWVTVTRTKTGRIERCRIVDVCNDSLGHCTALRRRGIVVELGFPAAQRLCNIKRAADRPPKDCRVSVSW